MAVVDAVAASVVDVVVAVAKVVVVSAANRPRAVVAVVVARGVAPKPVLSALRVPLPSVRRCRRAIPQRLRQLPVRAAHAVVVAAAAAVAVVGTPRATSRLAQPRLTWSMTRLNRTTLTSWSVWTRSFRLRP